VTTDKPKKWVPPKGGALHLKPRRDAAAELRANVLGRAHEVFDRYVNGESYKAIAATMPFEVAGWKLRSILTESEETKEMFANVLAFRADALVDEAVEHGRMAAAIGDSAGLRAAIDVNLKVASKLAPREYGDTSKLELTGKNGGALELKADLTLTAEQAYERLIKGK